VTAQVHPPRPRRGLALAIAVATVPLSLLVPHAASARTQASSTLAAGRIPAPGQVGFRAEVVANPHNQTLAVAIQWGVFGIVVLFALWWKHLTLFRGEGLAAWIGLLVVVQNIFTSLFNSHLFDFHEGWIYVLGVGVAGGMVLGAKRDTEPVASLPS